MALVANNFFLEFYGHRWYQHLNFVIQRYRLDSSTLSYKLQLICNARLIATSRFRSKIQLNKYHDDGTSDKRAIIEGN